MSDHQIPRPAGPSYGVKRVVGPVLGDMKTKMERPARKSRSRMPRLSLDATPAAAAAIKID